MSLQDSAIDQSWVAIGNPIGLPIVHTALRKLRNFWNEQRLLQERLLDTLCPWDNEGHLHWRREFGTWRLVGASLPPELSDHSPPS